MTTRCDRCGLDLHGSVAHATADECVRYLKPRLSSLQAFAHAQTTRERELKRRLERALRQASCAAEALAHEKVRARGLEAARTLLWGQLNAERAALRTLSAAKEKLLRRLRKIAGERTEAGA